MGGGEKLTAIKGTARNICLGEASSHRGKGVRQEMKKEQRQIYIELGTEIDASLCTFCKYANFVNDGCCEGYAECEHPIENLSYQARCDEDLPPDTDCWGFNPSLSVSLVADIVGAVLATGWDEWAYIKYSRKSLTVYGRQWQQGKENAGKVRIGYVGPEVKE